MIIAFAVIVTMCGREIVRLKAENISLKRQHSELEKERDELDKELDSVGDKEYIKDQARKQLRLLDPGELMFLFEDGKGSSDREEESDAESAEDSGENSAENEETQEADDAED